MWPLILDRATFDRDYHAITWPQHWQAVRTSLRRETYGPMDVLMEVVDAQTVQLFPAEGIPWIWRSRWRKQTTTGEE